MSDLDESLQRHQVCFIPWAPSWEDGIASAKSSHTAVSLAAQQSQALFSDTQRELFQQGVKLVCGVQESHVIQKIRRNDLLSPVSPVATSHYIISRFTGSVETLIVTKEDDESILLVAEKQTSDDSVLWRITCPHDEMEPCELYSNVKKNSFNLVYNGFEQCAIQYRKPNQKTVYLAFDAVIPSLTKTPEERVSIPYEKPNSYLSSQIQSETVSGDCTKLTVREPILKDGRYLLLFNGRVKKSSRKNFILIHPDQPSRELLLCGWCGRKKYVMDVAWPLSVLQSFGIFLTLCSQPKQSVLGFGK